MTEMAMLERPAGEAPRFAAQPQERNPWASDYVLLNLSVWWVKMTRPDTLDFAEDVANAFTSLRRDLT